MCRNSAGNENNLPVRVRDVLTRRGPVLSVSRLTRSVGAPLLLRHAYRLVQQN